MNDTTCIQDGFTQAPNVAISIKLKGQAKVLPMDWQYIDWVYTYSPAGGINSNVIDMAKWMVLQLRRSL